MTTRQLLARLERLERKRKSVAPPAKFAVDPLLARELRDDIRRLEEIEADRSSDPEVTSKLRAGICDFARAIGCPVGYTSDQADKDRERLDELHRKRGSPRATLSDAEDAEEAQLTARLWAFDLQPGPDDRGWWRLSYLTFKEFERPLTFWEQRELEFLRVIYPEEHGLPSDDPLAESSRNFEQAVWESFFNEGDKNRRASLREEDEIIE
jgi:hypothetical protein